ncbi:alpha-E domain-containing protein [Leeia oryzae]|uniref:alpha-E domain-containing protein n=1 Tax=Leeia oryzae TaxID=356662 RepID=UPI0003A5BA4F|nr:alpha-E domain-containing protein [Leeia oryzae]
MLSRTASHLFWMSRYLERAENLARMLDVSFTLSLLRQKSWDTTLEISAPLSTTGTLAMYQEKHGSVTPEALLHFLAWDQDNPASILSCLKNARENAHAVRGQITSEMWENINATWLEVRKLALNQSQNPGQFFEWVKERSHLFRGVTYGTILRNQAYSFIRLGTFLERADNTARILNVNSHLIQPADYNKAPDFYHWSALLKSISAFESYQQIYREEITPATVSELLILRKDMPRALLACMNELHTIFEFIQGENGRLAKRKVAEVCARLGYTDIQEVFDEGLQNWLGRFLKDIQEIGDLIHVAYLDAA